MIHFFESHEAEIQKEMNSALLDERNNFINHRKSRGRGAIKSGYSSKTIYSLDGKLNLIIPLLRGIKQSDKLFPKFKSTTDDFEKLIASLLSISVSWAEIIDIINSYTGIKIGHSIVERVSKQLQAKKANLKFNKISKEYLEVLIDVCSYKFKTWYDLDNKCFLETEDDLEVGEKDNLDLVKKEMHKVVFIATGLDNHGHKDLLLTRVFNVDNKTTWNIFLHDLKKRGLKTVGSFVCDFSAGIEETIKRVFKNTEVQFDTIREVKTALKHVSCVCQAGFKKLARTICLAKTKDEAINAYTLLVQKYEKKCPKAVTMMKTALDKVLLTLDTTNGKML